MPEDKEQPTQTVSANIPLAWADKLKSFADTTGKSQGELLLEAIGQYLGLDVLTIDDRLQKLEQEVATLRGKFRLLSSG
jgi:hypothetical protein